MGAAQQDFQGFFLERNDGAFRDMIAQRRFLGRREMARHRHHVKTLRSQMKRDVVPDQAEAPSTAIAGPFMIGRSWFCDHQPEDRQGGAEAGKPNRNHKRNSR